MATAEEILLAEAADDTLLVDLDLRTIVIPPTVKLLGVESDKKVKHLNFRVPVMYGQVDLSDFDIRINYFNARLEGDTYPVTDKTISDGYIAFSWEVDEFAFKYKGSVKFIVCLRELDASGATQRELNTTHASLPVLEGLETTQSIIENYPDIIDAMLLRLDTLERTGGVTDEQIANAVEQYLEDNPAVGAPGPQGPQGEQGPQGPAGTDGIDGEDGADGADGKSAYAYAQEGGYTGTEEEFGTKLAELLSITSAEGASF